MRVGILYDLFDDYPWRPNEPEDADAENEPPETIDAIAGALRILGHDPVLIGPPHTLLRNPEAAKVDIAVNISEAAHSRNREGFGPTLLEMLGVPYIGSDAVTLSISLDKAITKDIASAAGLTTPAYIVVRPGSSPAIQDLPGPFPLFVKPRYEGSAKGINIHSKVADSSALSAQIERIHADYGQDALVETFVEGAEYTVAVLGEGSGEALPAMQRAVEEHTGIGLHALAGNDAGLADHAYRLPGLLTADLEVRLQRDARSIFRKLECRDFARVDFRVDSEGQVWFLEINPLPTFAPDGTFAILAEMKGVEYEPFLAEILGRAIDRVMPPQT